MYKMFVMNIFGTKITEIIFKGNSKYFRDGAFRTELCLYMIHFDFSQEIEHNSRSLVLVLRKWESHSGLTTPQKASTPVSYL